MNRKLYILILSLILIFSSVMQVMSVFQTAVILLLVTARKKAIPKRH